MHDCVNTELRNAPAFAHVPHSQRNGHAEVEARDIWARVLVRTDEPLKASILPQRIEPRINAQHRNRYVTRNFYQLLQVGDRLVVRAGVYFATRNQLQVVRTAYSIHGQRRLLHRQPSFLDRALAISLNGVRQPEGGVYFGVEEIPL